MFPSKMVLSLSRATACTIAFVLASPLPAQVHEGELLVGFFGSGGALRHYRSDGTLVAASTQGSGLGWFGAAITEDGRWVTGYISPPRIGLHHPGGFELSSFEALAVDGLNLDLGVLSDGTLAIVDSAGEIELYSDTGVHQGTLAIPGAGIPFSLGIDAHDELWVGDLTLRRLWHLTRDGTLLGTIDTLGDVPGDVDFASDGTVWTRGRHTGRVFHFARDGVLLGTFSTVVSGIADGIAVDPDGSLWLTNLSMPAEARRYDSSGALLASFPLPPGAIFTTVSRRPGRTYCTPAAPNSTGMPGRISALGSSAVAVGDVTLFARDLPPGEIGYFLVGSNSGQLQPPGSQGTICIACTAVPACVGIGRFDRPGEILLGPAGSLAIDLSALPLTPAAAVMPGETWSFQCWYQDQGTSNFTDAVSIVFR